MAEPACPDRGGHRLLSPFVAEHLGDPETVVVRFAVRSLGDLPATRRVWHLEAVYTGPQTLHNLRMESGWLSDLEEVRRAISFLSTRLEP